MHNPDIKSSRVKNSKSVDFLYLAHFFRRRKDIGEVNDGGVQYIKERDRNWVAVISIAFNVEIYLPCSYNPFN